MNLKVGVGGSSTDRSNLWWNISRTSTHQFEEMKACLPKGSNPQSRSYSKIFQDVLGEDLQGQSGIGDIEMNWIK